MPFEDLLLTSQNESADRQRAITAQGMRTFPDAHALKKVVQGPFRLHTMYMQVVLGQFLVAVPGYRYFVHSASVGAVNTPATACQNVYWVGTSEGSPAAIAYAPLIPNTNFANGQMNVLDIFMDENTSITWGVTGGALDSNGTLTYQLVRVGDE